MGKHFTKLVKFANNFTEFVRDSGEKSPNKDMGKIFFQLSNLSQSVLLENPTHWGLDTAVCPIFAKPA